MKELLLATFEKRRRWINESKSTDLSLSHVFHVYPCFGIQEILIEELRHIVVKEKVNGFESKCYFLCNT